jgi:SRSO17 transposase
MPSPKSETEFAAEEVEGIEDRLAAFLKPYMKVLTRVEQWVHAEVYVKGRLQQLPRRTVEPIATDRGRKRRPLQHFIGAGKWDDAAIRKKMCRDVATEIGSDDGVLILDGSGFQKTGPESVGTQRQWCGRLGKEEQCQVGEFLAYASRGSVALVGAEIYLPKSWATDTKRRARCHVPPHVTFKTGWRLAADMVFESGKLLPHRWVVGDENYGRPTELRDLFHQRGERYVLEVHCDAKVRLARGGDWTRADEWASTLPRRVWKRFRVSDGEKGPIEVRAVKARVYTPRPHGGPPERPETLLVVRNDRDNKTWTYLASDTRTNLKELVRVGSCRHGIEQAFNMGKGEVGLDEYEVRSWVGWHHHMTLSMLSMWFLTTEQRRIKKILLRSPVLRSVVHSLSLPREPERRPRSPRSSHSSSPATTKPATAIGGYDVDAHRRDCELELHMPEIAAETHHAKLAQFN